MNGEELAGVAAIALVGVVIGNLVALMLISFT